MIAICVYCKMIIPKILVNIHHPTELQLFFPCEVRTFRILSLSGFQIYAIVLLTIFTMLSITFPELTYLITGSWYL